ncbi:MAG: hypothetical protein AAGI30_11320 [Planctomycetota bacterium]
MTDHNEQQPQRSTPRWRPIVLGATIVIALVFATMLALSGVRQEARVKLSINNCRQIAIGIQNYAAANDDLLPPSIEELIPYMIEGSGLPHILDELLVSPMRPASDPADGYDYLLRTDLTTTRIADIGFPSSTILALDAYMLACGHSTIAVALADGTARRLTRAELRALCDAPFLTQNHPLLELFEIDRWIPPQTP